MTTRELVQSLQIVANELETKINSILKTIKILERYTFTTPVSSSDPGYNKTWNFAEKFYYLIKREGRFLHVREAAEMIIELEGGYLMETAHRVSTHSTSLRRSKKIVKYQINKAPTKTFWGLPEWLDYNNEICKGHEINPINRRKPFNRI